MPTTQEEKPAKPRQRNRKTDHRNPKGEKKVEARVEENPVSAVMAPIEAAQVEITPVEITPIEITPVEITPVEIAPVEIAPVEIDAVEAAPAAITPVAITMEKAGDAALSGEVLPPEVREHAPQTAGARRLRSPTATTRENRFSPAASWSSAWSRCGLSKRPSKFRVNSPSRLMRTLSPTPRGSANFTAHGPSSTSGPLINSRPSGTGSGVRACAEPGSSPLRTLEFCPLRSKTP